MASLGSGPIAVDDPSDPRIADYVGLKDSELRRRREEPGGDTPGLFIAEGALVLRRLLASRYRIRSVLVTPQRYGPLAADLAATSAPVYLASQPVMNAVAGFDLHRGVLAAADRRPLPRVADLLAGARRVAVLENVNDHENLGVIFRSAAALGIEALLLSPECCDPLYRRSVRVSMGHVLDVAFGVLAPWPEALSTVCDAGFRLVALTPDPSVTDIRDLGLARAERVALMLGAEGPGLSEGAMQRATVRARIAMVAGVDSLNVGSAAAIAFHAAMPAVRDSSR
jgi:tRNA G18 (ribose-2'-O)-methylase SpoU